MYGTTGITPVPIAGLTSGSGAITNAPFNLFFFSVFCSPLFSSVVPDFAEVDSGLLPAESPGVEGFVSGVCCCEAGASCATANPALPGHKIATAQNHIKERAPSDTARPHRLLTCPLKCVCMLDH